MWDDRAALLCDRHRRAAAWHALLELPEPGGAVCPGMQVDVVEAWRDDARRRVLLHVQMSGHHHCDREVRWQWIEREP